jgi:hypothetical protein
MLMVRRRRRQVAQSILTEARRNFAIPVPSGEIASVSSNDSNQSAGRFD